jgi:D-3-phosphoglycerate dehydrogenase
MMMYKVKTLNEISPIYEEYLPKAHYSVGPDIKDPDAVLVRSADMHNAHIPDSLLTVARAGAGVNNIPVDALAKRGVVVFNTPGANANAVRELAVAALLLSSRKIIGGIEWVRTLKGQGAEVAKLVEKGKSKYVGPELRGKTLGVIGLGEVGVLVANAGAGLDMNVLGYDPYVTVEHAWMLSRSVQRVSSQEELLARSDYVSIHIPLMDQTRGSFDAAMFEKMKPGATVINLSRGELVVNEDVLAAIGNRHIRAYVTDFPADELIGEKGVIAIPHLGASTPESEENCVVMASRQIDDYLRRGAIRNSVNYPDCELGDIVGHRICVLHANVQGVVGAITARIAALNINIGGMMNRSRGKYAYTAIDLDDSASPELAQQISGLETVYAVRCL